MSDAVSVAMWLGVLLAAYILTRKIGIWRAVSAGKSIIGELKRRGAHDPASAVELPDARRNMLRPGIRSFRPEGLRMLLIDDIVAMTPDERYYLKNDPSKAEYIAEYRQDAH